LTPFNLFRLELVSSLAGARALLMRLGFTLLIALPFVLIAMPVAVKASGIVMIVLFTSFFGAAVGLARKRSDGQLERLRLLPQPLLLPFFDIVLAGAVVDLLQILPVLILYFAVNGGAFASAPVALVLALLIVTLLPLNLLGVLLGLAMRSNAEVHLAGALSVGVLAVLSGLAPLPRRLAALSAWAGAWNPAARLRDLLVFIGEDGVMRPSAAPALATILLVAAAVLWRLVDWNQKGR
jgi:hypothetical protein